MSLFNINLTGVASEVESALYSYIVQPFICLIQDAVNWIIFALFYFSKVVCDLFFSFIQAIYNFVLSILQDIIQLLASAINGIVSTLRAKLVPAFVVAITPKAEEELIRYTIRGVTHSNSFKQGLIRGILGGLTGMGIPILAYMVGSVIDSIIPNQAVDVTNLLFPIQTLKQLSKDICCPITNVTAPQCKNICGAVNAPACSPPCLELSNGNTYCFGAQWFTIPSSSTSTSGTAPQTTVTLTQYMTVTTS